MRTSAFLPRRIGRIRPIGRITVTVLALTAIAFSAMGSPPALTAVARPNIVLIMTDDQGWADLGIHGNPRLETPNIDRFARVGVQTGQL
jgi:hypothetical protein